MLADAISGRRSYGTIKAMGYPDNFVTKILCLSGGEYLVGFYGGGVVKSIKPYKLVDRKPEKTRFKQAKEFFVTKNDFPKLPSPIKPQTADALKTMYNKLKTFQSSIKTPKIFALNDDWRTQGDWIDTYGQYAACLCGQGGGGLDLYKGYSMDYNEFRGFIGRNFKQKNDALRHWVHWEDSTDKRVLQCFLFGGRRQSEWDDHGEAYERSLDGQHIYGAVKLQSGNYFLSLISLTKTVIPAPIGCVITK
jgi:hypothetical protein